jgi:hypothetical protein
MISPAIDVREPFRELAAKPPRALLLRGGKGRLDAGLALAYLEERNPEIGAARDVEKWWSRTTRVRPTSMRISLISRAVITSAYSSVVPTARTTVRPIRPRPATTTRPPVSTTTAALAGPGPAPI